MQLEVELKNNSSLNNDSNAAAFNEAVKQMVLFKDPKYAAIMLSYLNDDCEYDDVIKNIIGMAETFAVNCYIDAVVDLIDDLKDKAHDWLEIIHYRITNSKAHTEAYRQKMKALNYPANVVDYLNDFLSSNQEKNDVVKYIVKNNS
ncbi:Imm30 family immunity protein [Cronobacter dublinensis]